MDILFSKPRGKTRNKCPLGEQSHLDTKCELPASQNQGIRKHTWHTIERIEKRTAKISRSRKSVLHYRSTPLETCAPLHTNKDVPGVTASHTLHIWIPSGTENHSEKYSEHAGTKISYSTGVLSIQHCAHPTCSAYTHNILLDMPSSTF